MLVHEGRDPLDGVGRVEGGMHQLQAFDAGVGHVTRERMREVLAR